MNNQTRRVHFADIDFDHASAVLGVSTRDVEITKSQSEEWSAAMAVCGGNPRVNRRRRQIARIIWDVWHGPYDEPPPWDDLDRIRRTR
jgi:hypothetical protein